MKTYLAALLLALCVTAHGEKGKKRKPQSVPAESAATSRVTKSETQKFSGLKLKGQLKKPDLSYIYKRKGLRAEQIVNIPENFNDQIVQGENQF